MSLDLGQPIEVQSAAFNGSSAPIMDIAPRRRRSAGTQVWGPPLAVFAGFIAFWYLLSEVVLSPDSRFLLPPPHEVVQTAFLDWDNFKEILVAVGRTAEVAAVGLVIAIALGIAFSVLMSQAVWIERSLFPYAVLLQCIPILALVPLLGFWFGFGFKSRVIVCVMISLFPIINNTLFGLLAADRGLHDLFALHNRSRTTRLVKLQFPAAMPAIFSGLRIAAGGSVIGAVVGDFFFKQGDPGIGILISLYQSRLQAPQLFGAIIVACAFGIAVFVFFGMLSRFAVGSWHDTGRG